VLFEAPGRMATTLADLAVACGRDRPGAVCRELTKLHETIDRGTLGELAEAAADGRIPARGEFVLVVGDWAGARPAVSEAAATKSLHDARAEVERLACTGVGRSEAARRVAIATGLSRRRLYALEGRG
jgi:16S rRNA (cytidine1402-2'-O)-methyltransferase